MLSGMEILFPFLGGFGLFLYGMDAMSRGFQRVAGNRLKGLLRLLSSNPLFGVLSGTAATAVVQSSSVTTVMVVGFVNAGLMALPQAISIILGAHIGTTITGQIIAFQIQNFALPVIAMGSLMHLFGKTDRMKDAGNILFGFGALFFGLNLMSIAFDPLRENAMFQTFLTSLSSRPFFGFLVGTVVTVLVQSSSVTIGIMVALALDHALTLEQALPLILGLNLGTTITANLAALGGSFAAKQAARAHFIINAIGAFAALLLLAPFMKMVLSLSPEGDTARQIANAHTYYNILKTLFFLPFIGGLARLTDFFIFGEKRERTELYYLEKTSLQDPGTALDQVKIALVETFSLSAGLMKSVSSAVMTLQEKSFDNFSSGSQKIERYQSRITEFLEKIMEKNLSAHESRKIPRYVRILHEVERIRDYEAKIAEVVGHLQSEGRKFSPQEKQELEGFFKAIKLLFVKTGSLLMLEDKKSGREIMRVYDDLRKKKEELRERSRRRLMLHHTGIATSNYYHDVITALEEIAKKCRNIAAAVIG